MNLFGRLPGINSPNKRVIQCGEDVMAFLKSFALFELIRFTVADSNALKGGVGIELEDEDQIGNGGKGFVRSTDPGRIKSAGTLIGHGGKKVAIENHDGTPFQGRLNEIFDVLTSIKMEEVELLLRRKAAGLRRLAETLPVRAIGGLLGGDNFMPHRPEGFGQKVDLRRFPGPVDTFKNDKHG